MKKRLSQFFLYICIFVFSTFLHECAHGIQSCFSGISVSTGFNRVGNAFMYPGDAGFRTGFVNDFPVDAAVALTLMLAVIFTVLYVKMGSSRKPLESVVFSFAFCNSIIRLVPSLLCLVLPVFGTAHAEDETGMGQLWASSAGIAIFKYLPALISVLISLLCICFIVKKRRKEQAIRTDYSIIGLAYIASFFIENLLDGIIRINWISK